MSLYNLTDEVIMAAEALEAALEWEPDTDADGNPIDGDGNIIEDVEAYRAALVAAWTDTLEGAQLEWEQKVAGVACYEKSLEGDIKQLTDIIRGYQRRLSAKRKAAERVKAYLEGELIRAGKTKVDTAAAVVALRQNPESVDITDELAVIQWAQVTNRDYLLKYTQPEISKTALKPLLKSGEDVPGAAIIRRQTVSIK